MFQLSALDYLFLVQQYKNSLSINTFTLIENKNQECLIPYIKKNIQRNISNSIIHSHKITKGFSQKEYPYLIKDKKIVYVGKTENGISRIFAHKDKDFDSYSFFNVARSDLDWIESVLISILIFKNVPRHM